MQFLNTLCFSLILLMGYYQAAAQHQPNKLTRVEYRRPNYEPMIFYYAYTNSGRNNIPPQHMSQLNFNIIDSAYYKFHNADSIVNSQGHMIERNYYDNQNRLEKRIQFHGNNPYTGPNTIRLVSDFTYGINGFLERFQSASFTLFGDTTRKEIYNYNENGWLLKREIVLYDINENIDNHQVDSYHYNSFNQQVLLVRKPIVFNSFYNGITDSIVTNYLSANSQLINTQTTYSAMITNGVIGTTDWRIRLFGIYNNFNTHLYDSVTYNSLFPAPYTLPQYEHNYRDTISDTIVQTSWKKYSWDNEVKRSGRFSQVLSKLDRQLYLRSDYWSTTNANWNVSVEYQTKTDQDTFPLLIIEKEQSFADTTFFLHYNSNKDLIKVIGRPKPGNSYFHNFETLLFYKTNYSTDLKKTALLKNLVSIYPNPASNIINIRISTPISYDLVLYDINGVPKGYFSNSKEINISHLDAGIYLLQITDKQSGDSYAQRIIKR